MTREAIGVGETELDALNDAKRQLGLSETDDVEFELIQRAEKKKFGLFGGAPAKVKVILQEEEPEQKLSAEEFLRQVLDKMGLESITIDKKEVEGGIEFDLEGEDVGFVIGRRGETLDSLQYLTSLVANHSEKEYVKVTINTGDYREKREKTLEILGRKLAFKAIKTGKKTSLEPMNPYERRIIHTAVQKIDGATSWSEGENGNRHVVIGVDPNHRVRKPYKGGGKGGRGGNRGGRRPYNGRGGSKPQTPPADPNRVPLNEGGETGLYGRIDKKEN